MDESADDAAAAIDAMETEDDDEEADADEEAFSEAFEPRTKLLPFEAEHKGTIKMKMMSKNCCESKFNHSKTYRAQNILGGSMMKHQSTKLHQQISKKQQQKTKNLQQWKKRGPDL